MQGNAALEAYGPQCPHCHASARPPAPIIPPSDIATAIQNFLMVHLLVHSIPRLDSTPRPCPIKTPAAVCPRSVVPDVGVNRATPVAVGFWDDRTDSG